ncbi:hypothetical protein Taro_005545 [Colocasia esculenta]|uniref:Uncharacterized protein n=1 Tax=Colocasia esculenta TaxID=4460 RepID=A0A843TUL2_COLES|nr:hypothetical protein [Colocasia esculenta]
MKEEVGVELRELYPVQTSVVGSTPTLLHGGLKGFSGALDPRKLFTMLLPSLEAHLVTSGPVLLQVFLEIRPSLVRSNNTDLGVS